MPGRSGSAPLGKLQYNELLSIIYRLRTSFHPQTILGPKIGEDAAFIDLGNCILVAHVDPITEAAKGSGRLAVIVASNDIAVSGARPKWALALFLLPPSSTVNEYNHLFEEVGDEARKLGLEIIGGHTERSPGLLKPVIALSVMGCACRECIVPTGGAKPGDIIIQVGGAAREGALILAEDFKSLLVSAGVEESVIKKALDLIDTLSIVEVAVKLADNRLVSSMHDATEGGLLGALVEAALTSNNLFKIYKNKIIINEVVLDIVKALQLDPLKLISSGTIVATAPPDKANKVIKTAEALGYESSIIGIVEKSREPGVVLVDGDHEYFIKEPPIDEISRFWV